MSVFRLERHEMMHSERVAPALATALEGQGYSTLTPVQEAMLDPDLEGADLLVSAQTGSGKTVAFGIAIAENLLGDAPRLPPAGKPLALVIAPTRELALQVKRELGWLYGDAGGRIASCVGGMSYRDELSALQRGAHIVVGTPGRLIDHLNRGSLDMSGLAAIVLDEADEMLDLGFREDLETLLGAAPAERRTLMFSATVSKPIAKLAESYQRQAVRVNMVTGEAQHADIEYRALVVAPSSVEHAIFNLLRYQDAPNALVFCRTRMAVTHLSARLINRGMSVVSLSGELSQKERSHALQSLRDGRAKVCVATDVAARGIDLPSLELVIHADLPTNPESLLHRSGRTGRAGRKGVSALIIPGNARRRAERLLGDARIEASWGEAPSAEEVQAKDDERLMSHPALLAEIDADDTMIASLAGGYAPEQLASAFLALARQGRAAPEDLAPVPDARAPREPREPRPPREDASARRADFHDSVWVRLSIGRKHQAEPRRLLPMVCKAGGLTRGDVGAIRLGFEDSHVELTKDAASRFFAALGASGTLEKGVTAMRADGPPEETPRGARSSSSERPERPDRLERSGRPERPAYAPRERTQARTEWQERPARAERSEPPARQERSDKVDNAARPSFSKDKYAKDKFAKGKFEALGHRPRPSREASSEGAAEARKPYRPEDADAKRTYSPRLKPGPKPGPKPDGEPRGAPAGGGEKPSGKPAGKPAGKSKAGYKGKAGFKPYLAKSGTKPAGKTFAGKPKRPKV
jgi:ATP-dependent RNA helicase DeaD